MATQTFEGTWEEIKRRESILAGHRLRVTVLDAPLGSVGPNRVMAEALRRNTEALKDMRETSGEGTQDILRRARDGGMFGYDLDR